MADLAPPRPPVATRHPNVRFRPFRDDADHERLAGLWKASNLHDGIPWLPTAGKLRSEMASRASVDPTRGWLERISVRRPWRRRGLARAITAESLRRLRAAGLSEAMLGVDSENPN